MSSPLSNLKKQKKSPFFPTGSQHNNNSSSSTSRDHSNVPFRHAHDRLLDEVTTRMNSQKIAGTSRGYVSDLPEGMPSDLDLMQTMISKISILEKRNQLQAKEIMDKDKRISVLEEKVRLYQKVNENTDHLPRFVRDLETKCLILKQQLSEMEEFLLDYGMIWVGEKSDMEDDDMGPLLGSEEGVWNPKQSLVSNSQALVIDYDKIIENIKDLNELAGEGEAKIQKTSGGARFKVPDPVQLMLYANGIVLFDGPFRPFSDESTRLCIRDITDGYFPSELQDRYPDGVPFKIVDKRDVVFKPKAGIQAFSGVGQSLGGDEQPSRLVSSILTYDDNNKANQTTESTLPGAKLTVEQFLSHLPSSVTKGGKVVDIRSSLENTIRGNNSQNTVTVVETNTMQELKERLEIDESVRPPSGKNITTLRIRDTDNHIYVLKMRFTDTVSDVRAYLDEQRNPNAGGYTLVTTFPSKVYIDLSESLFAAGLTPNATMHIRPTEKGKH